MRRIFKISEEQMNELITDNMFESINKLILENLSISDEVQKFADEVVIKMDEEYKKAEILSSEIDNVEHKYFSFRMNFLNYNVYIQVNVYLCNSSDEDFLVRNYAFLTDCSSISKKKVFNTMKFSFLIPTFSKSERPCDVSFSYYLPTIQHEVNHIYQQICKGDVYSNNNINAKYLYAFSNSNIHSQDDIERNVALAIYLTQYAEQDSFANELDAELRMNYEKINDRNVYKNSDVYKRILELKNCYSFLINNKDKVKTFLFNKKLENKFFKLDYKTLINLCRVGEQRMKNKMARIAIRARDNIQIEMLVRDCFDEQSLKQLYLI